MLVLVLCFQQCKHHSKRWFLIKKGNCAQNVKCNVEQLKLHNIHFDVWYEEMCSCVAKQNTKKRINAKVIFLFEDLGLCKVFFHYKWKAANTARHLNNNLREKVYKCCELLKKHVTIFLQSDLLNDVILNTIITRNKFCTLDKKIALE